MPHLNKMKQSQIAQTHNSDYTLRSSLPTVAAVLGLRHIFSEPAFGLISSEKKSHSHKRYGEFVLRNETIFKT